MKYFLDCGAHHGEGLLHFIEKLKIDSSWRILSFEPNKEAFQRLKELKIDGPDVQFINKGVWTENGNILFNAETKPKERGGDNDGEGSTFIDLTDWNIKENNPGAGDFNISYLCDVIDFSEILNSLENPDLVVVKMDIEGSEYPVLRKIISDRSATVINEIYCEFHDWAMPSEDKGSTMSIIGDLESMGIRVHHWG